MEEIRRQGNKIDQIPTGMSLSSANGEPLHITGKVKLNLVIKDSIFQHQAFVIQDLGSEFIIGSDFLQQHGGVINLEKNELSLMKQTIDSNTGCNTVTHDVLATKKATLQPHSSTIVAFPMTYPTKGDYVFEPDDALLGAN